MHQKLFFRAQNAKFSLPWEGNTPSQTLPPARSLRSLAIILADYFRRVSETWNLFFLLKNYVKNFHLVLFNS